MKRILYMISLLCLGLLSTGCDSEEQPGEEEKRTVEVPVEFNFTSSGNELTTRTNPVGPGNPGETNTVAPRVGAWIETLGKHGTHGDGHSRTPCGCVD